MPQGAPPSQTLYQILALLYTKEEAEWASSMPIRQFTTKKAARNWKVDVTTAKKRLDQLTSKYLLLDIEVNGEMQYIMPPPMAGFFEFALMRVRQDIDMKELSRLYTQYMDVEEDFIKNLFFGTTIKLGRTLVHEPIVDSDKALHILDYERATHILSESSDIAVGMCYCRHKALHMDKACDAPMDVCLTLGSTATSLVRHGNARHIEINEAKDIIALSIENNLVQICENVRHTPAFICNCCGCCCEGLKAANKFGVLQPIETSGFIPKVDDSCIGCGKCQKVCPIGAITMNEKHAAIDESICIGCGICTRNCHKKSIMLVRRERKVISPVNTTHRFIEMAIEKGQLQNLILDNQALSSHRAMAAILSAILKLPPIKQGLASRQFKSVYLDKLLEKRYRQGT